MYDANIKYKGEKAKLQFKEIIGLGFLLKLPAN